jgi:hypothetical protein
MSTGSNPKSAPGAEQTLRHPEASDLQLQAQASQVFSKIPRDRSRCFIARSAARPWQASTCRDARMAVLAGVRALRRDDRDGCQRACVCGELRACQPAARGCRRRGRCLFPLGFALTEAIRRGRISDAEARERLAEVLRPPQPRDTSAEALDGEVGPRVRLWR